MKSCKRNMLALLLPATLALGASAGSYSFGRETMGTWGELILCGPDSTALAARAEMALDCFTRVDSLMSNWTDTSEVARINREAHDGVTVHSEVGEVLAAAIDVGRASGGAFDITVEPLVRLWGFLGGRPHVPKPAEIDALLPTVGLAQLEFDPTTGKLRFLRPELRVDLGGVAKGHAVDQAFAVLREAGVQNGLINLSGNMRGMGHPEGREHWTVGIRDPTGPMQPIATLRLDDEAIATSGDYEQFVAADGARYGHILDPRTGWPAQGLAQVTVLAPSARDADAWATALFVLGIDAAKHLLARERQLASVLVQPDGSDRWIVWISPQLRGRVRILEDATDRFQLREL